MATKKNNPTGNRAVPNGSMTYHQTMPPRQLSTLLRHGNSTQQFAQLDRFVFDRIARFIARKHGSRNWRRGVVDLVESRTTLGIYRLAGTIGYSAAHASR
jgi:hypothetical protein